MTEVSEKYNPDFRGFWRDIGRAKRNGGSEDSKIVLVTAMRSKDHEYDAVIVLDCYALATDIEEEPMLMHVAMTRARKHLYFIFSVDKAESRFIAEMGLGHFAFEIVNPDS